jgi:hypothetical protein
MRFEKRASTIAPDFLEHLSSTLGLSAEEVLRVGGEWLLSTEAGKVLRATMRRGRSSADEAA